MNSIEIAALGCEIRCTGGACTVFIIGNESYAAACIPGVRKGDAAENRTGGWVQRNYPCVAVGVAAFAVISVNKNKFIAHICACPIEAAL